jgi:hypothetical protein
MMLIDFWVKFQDEKLASPSFGQSKWAGHESKYWNWTNCATLKLAGLFFQSNLRSYLNCQEYLFKMSIKSFVCVISIDRRQRVGLKATPPPSWGLCTVHWTYITFIRRNRRTLSSCTQNWFSPFFLFASKDSHWFRHCKQAETLSIQYT